VQLANGALQELSALATTTPEQQGYLKDNIQAPTKKRRALLQKNFLTAIADLDIKNGSSKAFDIPCVLGLVRPCGNVTIGTAPVEIKHPFGRSVIRSVDDFYVKTKHLDHVWKIIATLVVAVSLVLYLAVWLYYHPGILSYEQEQHADNEDDPHVSQQEIEVERAAEQRRLSIDAENFIAPGNIYRLLALLTPERVGGWRVYGRYAGRAFLTCYMQIILPYQLMATIIARWEFKGIKSIYYFAEDLPKFLTAFVSLAALCGVVQGKCIKSVEDGARANLYILTHEQPDADDVAAPAPQDNAGQGGVMNFFRPGAVAPQRRLRQAAASAVKIFWCTLSMTANVVSSLMLQTAMYMTIATFKGSVNDAALATVALYFILDLDDKIMEANPQLRKLYRRHVMRSTVETEDEPRYIKRAAGGMRILSEMMGPLGLGAIILFAWQERTTGYPIGTYPF